MVDYLLGEGGIHLSVQPLCDDPQLPTLELQPGLTLLDEKFVGEQPSCSVRHMGSNILGRSRGIT